MFKEAYAKFVDARDYNKGKRVLEDVATKQGMADIDHQIAELLKKRASMAHEAAQHKADKKKADKQATQEFWSEIGTDLKNKFNSIYAKATETATQVTNKMTEFKGKVADKVADLKDKTTDFGHKATDFGHKAADFGRKVGRGTAMAASKVGQGLASVAKTGVEKGKEFVHNVPGYVQTLKAKLGDVKDSFAEYRANVKEAYEAARTVMLSHSMDKHPERFEKAAEMSAQRTGHNPVSKAGKTSTARTGADAGYSENLETQMENSELAVNT